MAQAMAALRSAAMASAALSWRQPHLRRALCGLPEQISTDRAIPGPKAGTTPGVLSCNAVPYRYCDVASSWLSDNIVDSGQDIDACGCGGGLCPPSTTMRESIRQKGLGAMPFQRI